MLDVGTDDLLRLSREAASLFEAEMRRLQKEREELLDIVGRLEQLADEMTEVEADARRLREALQIIRDAHEPSDWSGASCAEGCGGRWPCVAWSEADVALSTP